MTEYEVTTVLGEKTIEKVYAAQHLLQGTIFSNTFVKKSLQMK